MASEGALERAFLRGVRFITDSIRVARLTEAIRRGDYQAVIDAVDIDDAAFDDFRRELMTQYAQAGIDVISDIRSPVPVRWNSASPYAEVYARTATGHINELTTQMRRAVQGAVADGIAFGRSERRVALDIAGRMGADGRRHGGMIGLNAPQQTWVANMRAKLNGVPDWPSIRGNTRRDHRFDRMIERAWAEGRPLSQAQIDRIIGRYNDRLLVSRANTIARTERGYAVNAAQADAYRLAADRVGIPHSAIIKTWLHSGSPREPRISHLALDRNTVRGIDTPFYADGVPLLHPHDPSGPADQVINCTCTMKYTIPKDWRNG